MNRQCRDIQATIVERTGEVAALDDRLRQHLESCAACRGLAREEGVLERTLAKAIPPADPKLQATVVTALTAVTRRRRWLAGMPVAASLLVMLVGLRALGGAVPGAGLATHIASRSGGSWFLVVDAAVSGIAGLATIARVLAEIVPLSTGLAAAAVALFGWIGVAALTRRWHRIPAWFARS